MVSSVRSAGSIPPGTLTGGARSLLGSAAAVALVGERGRLAARAGAGEIARPRLLRRGRGLALAGGALAADLARRRGRLGPPRLALRGRGVGARRRRGLRQVEQVLDPLDLRDRCGLRLELLDLVGALRLAAQPHDALGRVHVDLALVHAGAAEDLGLDLARDRAFVEVLGLAAGPPLAGRLLLALALLLGARRRLLGLRRTGVAAAAAGEALHGLDRPADGLRALLEAVADELLKYLKWIRHTYVGSRARRGPNLPC